MVPLKKLKISLMTVAFFILITVPCFAVEQETTITLARAKELARNYARILSTTEITKEKLGVESEIAHNTYMSKNIKNDINGYVHGIAQLYEELKGLDPGIDSQRIKEIQEQIATYEQRVSILTQNMPPESFVRNYKKAWRTTDEAYQDMTRVINNMEKNLDLTVEKLYFALLDLQSMIKLQNKTLLNLGKQLRIERLKIELGLSTKESEQSLISQYNLLYKTINDLKSNETALIWQLNDLMGRELNAPLQIQEENIIPVKTLYSDDAIYEKTVKSYLEIAKKERQIDNYVKDIAVEQDRDERELLKQDQKIAQIQLVDLKVSLKEKIKALGDQLESGYLAWETAVLEKEKVKTSHEYNEVRYKLGLISELQRDFSETAYLEGLNKEKQAARAWQIVSQQLALAEEGILE